MKTSQVKTQKKEDKSWVFILLLFLGLGIIYFSQSSEVNKSEIQIEHTPEHIKRVDTHLKDTAFSLEADRRQRQSEAYQQLNKLHNTMAEDPYRESTEFSLESDPYMQSLSEDLNRSRQAPADQLTPEEIVQQRLYEDNQLQKASESYRESYAQQFIENARKGGWEVELGPNFEVLSVKKIRERRGPSLFREGEMGGAR